MLHSLSVSLLFPSLTQPHSPLSSSLPLTVSLNPTSKLYVMWCISFAFFQFCHSFIFFASADLLHLMPLPSFLCCLFLFTCQWSPHSFATTEPILWLLFSACICDHTFHFQPFVSGKSSNAGVTKWREVLLCLGQVEEKYWLKQVHTVCSVFLRGQRLPCDSYRMFCILEFTASNLGIKICLWK